MEFPIMLYRPGTMFEWDGERFDYVICADQDEVDIATADGWVPHKPNPTEEAAAAEIKATRSRKTEGAE